MVKYTQGFPHIFSSSLYSQSSIAEIGLYLVPYCSSQFYNAKDMHETILLVHFVKTYSY